MDYLDNSNIKTFENDVYDGEKIEELKENSRLKKKFRSGLQKKYIEYRKNKIDRVAYLARDIFTLYFNSFEIFYAYSINLELLDIDVAINLKFKPGFFFNNYLKNLNEELNKNKKNNIKFQLAEIYEISEYERDFLNSLSNEKFYLKNIFDLMEDLKKDFEENYSSVLFNLKNLQRKETEEEEDEEALIHDYVEENLNKFLKEKKNLLKKFFRLNKHSDFESLEKNILKESNVIFLEKLKEEINSSLNELIKNLELNHNNNKNDNKEKEKLNEQNNKNNIKNANNNNNNSSNENIFLNQTLNSLLSISNNDFNNYKNKNNESKNKIKFKHTHKDEIKMLQFYLQAFIFEKNFLVYLSNITSFFYGIKSSIFIDKQENITLDFHAETVQLKSLANDYNYLLHLKIMISTHVINYEKDEDSQEEEESEKENKHNYSENAEKADLNFSYFENKKKEEEEEKGLFLEQKKQNNQIEVLSKSKKKDLEKDEKKYTTKFFDDSKGEIVYVHSVKEKNLIPFWKVQEQDITLHPPHLEFNLESEKFYRLYNHKDEFTADKENNDIELDFENKRSNDISNITDLTVNVQANNNNQSNSPKKNLIADKNNANNNKMNIHRFSTIYEGNPTEEEGASYLKTIIKEEAQQAESDLSYTNIPKNLNSEFNNLNNNNNNNNKSNSILTNFLNLQNKNSTNKFNDSNLFRNIDKLRLIKMSLNLIFDFDILKSYPEYLTFQVVRNEKAYKENLKFKNILGAYLDIFNDERIKKTNETMRNFYGEKVAYYFYFTSHYIKWLFFPSVLGIIFVFLEIIFHALKIFQIKNFEDKNEIKEKAISLRVYYVYLYLFFIVIWAVLNVKSWVSKQKYLNYCWGMDGNLVDSRIKTDNIKKAIVTMGIQIPIRSRYKEVFKSLVTVFISLLLIVFTVFMNFVLFELGKIKVFNADQATAVDGVIGASIKILGRKNQEISGFNGSYGFLPLSPESNGSYKVDDNRSYKKEEIEKEKGEKDLISFKNIGNTGSYSSENSSGEVKIEISHSSNNNNFLKKEKTITEEIPNRNSNENNNNNNNSEKVVLSLTQKQKQKQKKIQQDLKEKFSLFTYKNENKNQNKTLSDQNIQVIDLEHIKLKPTFWYHLIPVLSVLLRNLMSKVNYSTAFWMIKYEGHTEENTYEDSFLKKMVCYEFVNYYFYLYYIIFYKNYNNLCAGNNCYSELGSQLTTIIITSTLLNFIELLAPHVTILFRKVFSKNKNKESGKVNEEEINSSKNNDFTEKKDNDKNYNNKDNEEERESSKNTYNENPRNKFHDRLEYYDIMTYEYMELIMNFGYIILFGISSPICFLIAFLYAIVERFTDALKMTKSYNVNIIDKSTGIGIIVKILKFFIFMGILTNCIIVIFLMDFSHKGSWLRLETLLVMENILVVLFLLIAFNPLPGWFKYLDKIKFNYIVAILNNHKKLKSDESGTIYAKQTSL